MSSLRFTNSVTPSLTGVIVATALGSFSVACHAGTNFNPSAHEAIHKMEQRGGSFISQTFTSVGVVNSSLNENLDYMVINLFEKISYNAKPLDADLAQLLSENFIELF